MLNCKLENEKDVKKLVRLCEEFKEDIDVVYGRYTIDAKSFLGVISLAGHTVSVHISTDDKSVKKEFEEKFNRVITQGGEL